MTLESLSCCVCGINFAAPMAYVDAKRNTAGSLYCPNGHSIGWKVSEADKLRQERDRLKQQLAEKDDAISAERRRGDSYRDQRDHEQRRVAAAKGQVTKLKKRAQNGVCPCCNRTFADLARHMASKHPGFEKEVDAADNVVPLKAAK